MGQATKTDGIWSLQKLTGKLSFLGPRGALGTPSSARPSVCPSMGKKNLHQLNSSINHHRTTANLSDIVWCMSGSVWWCLEHVWWCLVASDACLVVSGGVNVYRLIWPELIDVYGQISLPVHLTDAAKMLMLLIRWCCWCIVAADALLLLMHWRCWCADVTEVLMLLMHCCC